MVKFEITSSMLDAYKGDERSLTIRDWIAEIGATKIEWAADISNNNDMICFEDEAAALVFRLKAGM